MVKPTKKLLPLVERIIEQVNLLFVEFVGPIGHELSDDAFSEWVSKSKTGPSSVISYAEILAKSISNSQERKKFLEKVNALMLTFKI